MKLETITIYHALNAKHMDKSLKCEPKNVLPSKTVPNQCNSLRDIMTRFRGGVGLPIEHEQQYNNGVVSETRRPDYDMVDAHEALQSINQKLIADKQKADEIKKAENEKRSAELEAEKIEKAVNQRLKSLEKTKKIIPKDDELA